MKVVPRYRLPPPLSAEVFETLMTQVATRVLPEHECQLLGSRGERQHGIDILCSHAQGPQIGIQCKCYEKYSPKLSTSIARDIYQSKLLEPDHALDELWLALTLKRNAPLQFKINRILRKELPPFRVKTFYWDDIVAMLEDHVDLFQEYYSGFFVLDSERLASSIEPIELPIAIDSLRPLSLIKQSSTQDILEPGSVMIDHGTLLLASSALGDKIWAASSYALSALIQIVECIVLSERIIVISESPPHLWERSGDSELSAIISPIDCGSRAVDLAQGYALEWFRNWSNDPSAHFLIAQLAQAHIVGRVARGEDVKSRILVKKNLLAHESDEVAEVCTFAWEEFLKRHRAFTPPVSLKLSLEEWEKALERNADVMLALLGWAVWRPIYYQAIALLLNVRYVPHPARSMILLSEASERNSYYVRAALGEISKFHERYIHWTSEKEIDKHFSFNLPPVFAYVAKRCRSSTELIEKAARLKDLPAVRSFRKKLQNMESALGTSPEKIESAFKELRSLEREIATKWNLDDSRPSFVTYIKAHTIPVLDGLRSKVYGDETVGYRFFFRSLLDDIRYANDVSREFSKVTEEKLPDIQPISKLRANQIRANNRQLKIWYHKNPPISRFSDENLHKSKLYYKYKKAQTRKPLASGAEEIVAIFRRFSS